MEGEKPEGDGKSKGREGGRGYLRGHVLPSSLFPVTVSNIIQGDVK